MGECIAQIINNWDIYINRIAKDVLHYMSYSDINREWPFSYKLAKIPNSLLLIIWKRTLIWGLASSNNLEA